MLGAFPSVYDIGLLVVGLGAASVLAIAMMLARYAFGSEDEDAED